MSNLSQKIQSKSDNVESIYIKTVLNLAKYYPQYTIEYIMNEMTIPTFLTIVNCIMELNKK